jgi:hypothetical protein
VSDEAQAGPDTEDAARPLDLQNVSAFLDEIGSHRFAENFNNAQRKTLFHYTDLGGLCGIVSKHDLWLTNCRFSNDDREMVHGYTVAKKIIAEEKKKATGDDEAYLKELDKRLDPTKPDDVYICCFCEQGNRLSQWRGYGANGAGVCIEIEAKGFSEAIGHDMPLGIMRVWKVYYEEKDQDWMVQQAIAFGRRAGSPAERAQRAADAIKFFIPTFKSQDFHEEGEWRLIFTPGPQCTIRPEFRVARQMLVPYFSFRDLRKAVGAPDDEILPVRKVLVGPNPRGPINRESVRMLLVKSKYPGVEVDASATSYRS